MKARVRARTTRSAPAFSEQGTPQLLLDLLDPSLAVAAALTFVEEVGSRDGVWWVAAIALLNLLLVRLIVRLLTLAVLGCWLRVCAFRDTHAAGARVARGE